MIATIAVNINTNGTTITDNCDCFFTSYVLIPSTLRKSVTSLRTMINTVCIFSSSSRREMTISGLSVRSHISHISSPVVLYAPFLMSKQYSYGRDPFQVTDKWSPSSWRIHNEPDTASDLIGSNKKKQNAKNDDKKTGKPRQIHRKNDQLLTSNGNISWEISINFLRIGKDIGVIEAYKWLINFWFCWGMSWWRPYTRTTHQILCVNSIAKNAENLFSVLVTFCVAFSSFWGALRCWSGCFWSCASCWWRCWCSSGGGRRCSACSGSTRRRCWLWSCRRRRSRSGCGGCGGGSWNGHGPWLKRRHQQCLDVVRCILPLK